MTRTLPAAVLAALAAIALVCPDAGAKLPDPRLCAIPAVVVGCPSGAAVPSCAASWGEALQRCEGFRVVVHDYNNAPLWSEEVVLDFSATPVRLLGDDRPGTTVDCAARTIRRFTDPQGVVVFTPRFCGGTEEARVRVVAEGICLREIPARSMDLDGDGRTGLADFVRVARNFLDGARDGATDFDPCAGEPGLTSLADFAVFAAELRRDAVGSPCP